MRAQHGLQIFLAYNGAGALSKRLKKLPLFGSHVYFSSPYCDAVSLRMEHYVTDGYCAHAILHSSTTNGAVSGYFSRRYLT